jgi:hypothetical protein
VCVFSGADLLLLFRALYKNDPQSVLTDANAVRLCFFSNKYAAGELEQLSLKACRKLALTAKLKNTTPTIPELLLLGQKVKDRTLLDTILKQGMISFCAPAAEIGVATDPLPALYCPQHGYEPIPCYHGCKKPPAPEALSSAGKAQLAKLNPKTLVKLICALVAAQRRPY